MTNEEVVWVEKIREGNEQAFRAVFEQYYLDLCGFAADYLSSVDRAQDIVQDVFLRVWKRREELDVHTSLKSYLFQAVRNRSLNERRRRENEGDFQSALGRKTHQSEKRTAEDAFHMEELSEDLRKAISDLPDRRRMCFLLHRRHGFTYKEIAAIMDISPKTVENQIGRALKSLYDQLADKLPQEFKV